MEYYLTVQTDATKSFTDYKIGHVFSYFSEYRKILMTYLHQSSNNFLSIYIQNAKQ